MVETTEENVEETFKGSLIVKRNDYVEILHPQGSQGWLGARAQLAATASVFAQAAGLSHNRGKTPENLIREKLGEPIPPVGSFGQMAMQHGKNMEQFARDYYVKNYHKRVIELGLIIPNWCPYIGVSVDGYCKKTNSIIEIKCPINGVYPELKEYNYRKKLGDVFPPFYHDHIRIDYYCQIQGGLAIMDAEYCDYIVYSSRDNEVCVTRVERNRDFWNNILYPKLLQFIEMLKIRRQIKMAEQEQKKANVEEEVKDEPEPMVIEKM